MRVPWEGTITVDYTERDRERRFKILEACNFDLDKARKLLQWVDVGDILLCTVDKIYKQGPPNF